MWFDAHRVILDASARRFQAQKVYLRATAAMKWINRYKQVMPNGGKPTNGQITQLQQAGTAMRAVCVSPPSSKLTCYHLLVRAFRAIKSVQKAKS